MPSSFRQDHRYEAPLSPEALGDIQEQFDACDPDRDDRIDFSEFSRLLERLGSTGDARRQRERFDEIDLDRDGVISREEFVEWLRAG